MQHWLPGGWSFVKRHKPNAPDDVELVAQGSSTVLLGLGHDPAARIGDLGTCKFSIVQGCSSVIIGGKTTTRCKIADGDDPEKALFNEIGKYGGYAALIGGGADVARETGMTPGAAEALKTGGRIFGLAFPLDGIQSRLPVAADAGFNADGAAESWANPNWLDGGHTAVRVGELGDPNESYLVNPTHEFVTDGGNPMPPGAVLFELGPNGSWMPIRRFQ